MEAKEVEKIYRLANLSLDGKDTNDLSDKFNKVIDFIEDVFDVDTDGVELTESIYSHKAVFRDDSKSYSVDREDALRNAPDKEFGYFRLDWKL